MLTKRQIAMWLLVKTVRSCLLLGLVAIALCAIVIVAALVMESLQIEGGQTGQLVRDWSYWLISGAPALLAAAWILFFGAALGSFMNVVVYRMPLGKSVTTRSSHCPRCKTPILARDNIPVIGWILLNGRCRACHLPISVRYPVVEAVSGLIVFGLVLAVLFLPAPNSPLPRGHLILRFGFEPDLFVAGIAQRFLMQTMVLLTILCSALIRRDRNPIPFKLVLGAWLIVGGAIVFFPNAVPVAAWPAGLRLDEVSGPGSLAILWQVLFAGLAGTFAGSIVGGRLNPGEWGTFTFSMDCAFGLGLLGMVLGWQFALATGLVFGVLLALWRLTVRQSCGDRPARLFLLLGVAFVCCCFWGYADVVGVWLPGTTTTLWQLPVWLIPLSLPALASLMERKAIPKPETEVTAVVEPDIPEETGEIE